MIVACSSCGTRFSADGYRDAHCPSCGAFAQIAADRPCPRCDLPLAAREISDLVVDECTKCHGVFLDHVAIRRVIDDRDMMRADSLLEALPRARHGALGDGRMY